MAASEIRNRAVQVQSSAHSPLPAAVSSEAAGAHRSGSVALDRFGDVTGSNLQQRFEEASQRMSALARAEGGSQVLTAKVSVETYGFFKQATRGDVSGPQPWANQVRVRAKYDAWSRHQGMSKEEAMRRYIDLVEGLPAP